MGIRHDHVHAELCECRPIRLGELWIHADDRVPMGMLARMEDLPDWPGPSPLDAAREQHVPPELCPRRDPGAELPLRYAPAVRLPAPPSPWLPATRPIDEATAELAAALDRHIEAKLAELVRTPMPQITINQADLEEVRPSIYDQITAALNGERPGCDCSPVHAWPDGPVIGYSSTCERHS